MAHFISGHMIYLTTRRWMVCIHRVMSCLYQHVDKRKVTTVARAAFSQWSSRTDVIVSIAILHTVISPAIDFKEQMLLCILSKEITKYPKETNKNQAVSISIRFLLVLKPTCPVSVWETSFGHNSLVQQLIVSKFGR